MYVSAQVGTYVYLYISWLRGGSKEKLCVHVAQVSDTVQVTRQVSLVGLIV